MVLISILSGFFSKIDANIIFSAAALAFAVFTYLMASKDQKKSFEKFADMVNEQKELTKLQTSNLKFIYKPIFQFKSSKLRLDNDNLRQNHIQMYFINEGATAINVEFESPHSNIQIFSFTTNKNKSLTVIKGKEFDIMGIIDLKIPEEKSIEEKLIYINSVKKSIPFQFAIHFEDEIGTKYCQQVKGMGIDPILYIDIAKPVEKNIN